MTMSAEHKAEVNVTTIAHVKMLRTEQEEMQAILGACLQAAGYDPMKASWAMARKLARLCRNLGLDDALTDREIYAVIIKLPDALTRLKKK